MHGFLQHEDPSKVPSFGTAGFRGSARGSLMDPIAQRLALYLGVRSASEKSILALCVTASHNAHPDNGFKIIEADGDNPTPEEERRITEFVQSSDPGKWLSTFLKLKGFTDVRLHPHLLSEARVILGADTRPTGGRLAGIAKDAITALGGTVSHIGVVTTPQLHFLTYLANQHPEEPISTAGYFQRFTSTLSDLCTILPSAPASGVTLIVDCAEGAASPHQAWFTGQLGARLNVSVKPVNCSGTNFINNQCGSEFTHKGGLVSPHILDEPFTEETHFCAFDGDADRLIYYTRTEGSPNVRVFDGDRISVLYIHATVKLLSQCKPIGQEKGVIRLFFGQTAYATCGSTDAGLNLGADLLKVSKGSIKLEHVCTKTGVKNLHTACSKGTIGIYFENNGHGTVIYKKDDLVEWATNQEMQDSPAFTNLMKFLEFFNPCTGDAMVDMMAAEFCLAYLGWSMDDWARAYKENPIVNLKVHMPKEHLAKLKPHPDHEKWLVEPVDLQKDIEKVLSKYKNVRSTVRPSGTEPICRVFVEAAENGEVIANEIQNILETFQYN